jgi:hypothetical protein
MMNAAASIHQYQQYKISNEQSAMTAIIIEQQRQQLSLWTAMTANKIEQQQQ